MKLAKPFDRLAHEDPSETFLIFILMQMPQTVGGVSQKAGEERLGRSSRLKVDRNLTEWNRYM